MAASSWTNTVDRQSVLLAVTYSVTHNGGTFAVPSLFPLHPTRGYAIGTSQTVTTADDPSSLADAIQDAAERITGACCVGTWFERESGLWHVDHVRVFPVWADAVRIGRENGQMFAYDFSIGQDVAIPAPFNGGIL